MHDLTLSLGVHINHRGITIPISSGILCVYPRNKHLAALHLPRDHPGHPFAVVHYYVPVREDNTSSLVPLLVPLALVLLPRQSGRALGLLRVTSSVVTKTLSAQLGRKPLCILPKTLSLQVI